MSLGGDEGGSGREAVKEVIYMVVLLGGDMCPLDTNVFDIYMISCSRQIVFLNFLSVIKLIFDRRTSILINWDLSTY